MVGDVKKLNFVISTKHYKLLYSSRLNKLLQNLQYVKLYNVISVGCFAVREYVYISTNYEFRFWSIQTL